VKIKGTCRRCGREFLVEQALDSGGKCPWCGQSFQADYAAVLVEALRTAEASGQKLENALEKVLEMRPAFRLDEESVVGDIRGYLERLQKGT